MFLWLLDAVTRCRESHSWILFLLPVAGLVIGTAYARIGGRAIGGTNLVLDTIHDGGPEIPLRMAPLVLGGTALTHLFGGSAGREGTAVQMGASLADWIGGRARLGKTLRRELLASGVAGGFGSVFGTPVAGALFAVEWIVAGRLEVRAVVPALVASVVGDLITRALAAPLGIQHTLYPLVAHLGLTPAVVAAWIAFGIAIAAVSTAFIEVTHACKRLGARHLPPPGVRMALGGTLVIALTLLAGTRAYLGLGVSEITGAFSDHVPASAWAWKLAFTAVTLGSGFLGGEVTPLFFIGATFGAILGPLLGLPQDLGAGVGMAAMFAAAANTPLAMSVMAVELCGAQVLPHVVIACVVAYVTSGRRSIYRSQRLHRKWSPRSPKRNAAPRVANHHAGAELHRGAASPRK